MQVLVSDEAETELYRLAQEGSVWTQREVARTYVYLRYLNEKIAAAPDFWNIDGSATGFLQSFTTRRNGNPIWRLCPTHVSCIALLTVQDGDLLVLAICSRAEIETLEQTLINC
jgi:hypothetical protein